MQFNCSSWPRILIVTKSTWHKHWVNRRLVSCMMNIVKCALFGLFTFTLEALKFSRAGKSSSCHHHVMFINLFYLCFLINGKNWEVTSRILIMPNIHVYNWIGYLSSKSSLQFSSDKLTDNTERFQSIFVLRYDTNNNRKNDTWNIAWKMFICHLL